MPPAARRIVIVTAPIGGITGRVARSEGSLITTGADSLLTTINQVNPIWVRFGLSESDTARLPGGRLDPKQETSVEILMPGGGVYPHKGRINFLSVYIDPKLGTQQLRAEFPNQDAHFMPGQFLRVRVTTGQQENVFLVPQAAVIQTEKGFMVWTVGEGDKVVYMLCMDNAARMARSASSSRASPALHRAINPSP